VELRALSWNLFHGRDAPPEPGLLTWRSRLLRLTERGADHAQVNRDLREQFAGIIAAADWDIALLQECPPRWAEALATRCAAAPHLVLTSRNLPRLASLQGRLADLNPDLIASWEGGCNLTLVRSRRLERSAIAERREHTLTQRPERRVMAFSRLEIGICVANLHASGSRELAEGEVIEAAAVAIDWAQGAPLLFGGDLNIRPARSNPVFEDLERTHGLRAPTPGTAIDHLLVTDLETLSPAMPWPPEEREVPDPTAGGATPALPVRLSDHAPVAATFGFTGDVQDPSRRQTSFRAFGFA
jgi:endonuclease/exonuclease/phosphatase family metal-dependent hydrolase